MSVISPPTLDIDLDIAPRDRWRPMAAHREQALALLHEFAGDIDSALAGLAMDEVTSLANAVLLPSELEEIRSVAEAIGAPFEMVLLGNLYYDALKHVWGCTDFAIPSPDGPLHARNLDWPSRGDALARMTLQVRFLRGGKEIYRTVGWPGYIACLSGIAPGRFSVTLNTVASEDAATFATPVSFLLRRLLESGADFAEAHGALRSTDVASDSLLLLVGTVNGDMAVIERTPTRSAVRSREGAVLVVTNDYRLLAASELDPEDDLSATSCDRFESVEALVRDGHPAGPDDLHRILRDSSVKMGITAQHMVFRPATGFVDVRYPAGTGGGPEG